MSPVFCTLYCVHLSQQSTQQRTEKGHRRIYRLNFASCLFFSQRFFVSCAQKCRMMFLGKSIDTLFSVHCAICTYKSILCCVSWRYIRNIEKHRKFIRKLREKFIISLPVFCCIYSAYSWREDEQTHRQKDEHMNLCRGIQNKNA